ncbi:MAG TPA: hypothetical protein VJY62_11590 [Bacteroidia bacterium]|nr:hypothetical protein [Bacteroidia bacterium]
MKKKFYLPTRETERVTWLNNFAGKLGGYSATFGITAGEVTTVNDMAALYSYIINLIEQSKTFTQELTKFKNTLSVAPPGTSLGPLPVLTPAVAPALTQAGIFTFIGGLVMRIKGTKGSYTPAIGEDLGIIGDETTFDAANYKTTLKGKSLPGNNEISFSKEGVDGINVYSHPVGSTDPNAWEKLAFDSSSPYNDTRALANPGVPENRKYRARGVINDVEIGQWSDILSLTFNS